MILVSVRTAVSMRPPQTIFGRTIFGIYWLLVGALRVLTNHGKLPPPYPLVPCDLITVPDTAGRQTIQTITDMDGLAETDGNPRRYRLER